MKRLLLLVPFFVAGSPVFAFWGEKTQWPTNWRQFKYPPSDKAKPYVTINFTQNLEEACKKYKVAYKEKDRTNSSYDWAFQRFQRKLRNGELVSSDFKDFIDSYHQKRWRADALHTSAGVEVLRQWGDPDWKNYSLYSIRGVGEKWQEGLKTKKFNPIDSGFSVLPYSKLHDICG